MCLWISMWRPRAGVYHLWIHSLFILIYVHWTVCLYTSSSGPEALVSTSPKVIRSTEMMHYYVTKYYATRATSDGVGTIGILPVMGRIDTDGACGLERCSIAMVLMFVGNVHITIFFFLRLRIFLQFVLVASRSIIFPHIQIPLFLVWSLLNHVGWSFGPWSLHHINDTSHSVFFFHLVFGTAVMIPEFFVLFVCFVFSPYLTEVSHCFLL